MNETWSVIISAHTAQRWESLVAAIASVTGQTLAPDEIIVVIDHNRDLYRRASSELHGVTVIENGEGQGLGGARTAGVKAASGSLVAFLDDDALAPPNWLASLAKQYERPEVVGVGGAVEPTWLEGRPAWFPLEFDWVVGCSYRGMPETTRTVRNLIGCNMSYRREALEEIGFFRVGCYGDETELCIRIGQRWPEKEIVYLPAVAVEHSIDASKTSFRRFVSRCFYEGGSKAVITHLVGGQDGLASERSYAREVLPSGFARDVRSGLAGDVAGFARAVVISVGLATTTAGYAYGKMFLDRTARVRGWQGPALRRSPLSRASS